MSRLCVKPFTKTSDILRKFCQNKNISVRRLNVLISCRLSKHLREYWWVYDLIFSPFCFFILWSNFCFLRFVYKVVSGCTIVEKEFENSFNSLVAKSANWTAFLLSGSVIKSLGATKPQQKFCQFTASSWSCKVMSYNSNFSNIILSRLTRTLHSKRKKNFYLTYAVPRKGIALRVNLGIYFNCKSLIVCWCWLFSSLVNVF